VGDSFWIDFRDIRDLFVSTIDRYFYNQFSPAYNYSLTKLNDSKIARKEKVERLMDFGYSSHSPTHIFTQTFFFESLFKSKMFTEK
jgi:hypothetical protein